jgi:hypothetical protein
MAASPDSNVVICHVGPLPSGTYIQLNLYNYWDDAGTQKDNSRCDQPGFPSSDCPGTVTIMCDGSTVLTFQDDDVMATPPPAPWSYTTVNNYLEIETTL